MNTVCPQCGFQAKTLQGLKGHMRLKHYLLGITNQQLKSNNSSLETLKAKYSVLTSQYSALLGILSAHLTDDHGISILSYLYCGNCGEDDFEDVEKYDENRNLIGAGWKCRNCSWEFLLFNEEGGEQSG